LLGSKHVGEKHDKNMIRATEYYMVLGCKFFLDYYAVEFNTNKLKLFSAEAVLCVRLELHR
jgi:hypothetical protein